MNDIIQNFRHLIATGNLREIPKSGFSHRIVDLSSNDYLGIADDRDFIDNFYTSLTPGDFRPTSSASRLLASEQTEYFELEGALGEAYNRAALLFNSGYHANTGIIQALGNRSTLFIADKLVHASIIDGMNLAIATGAKFMRFRHNDFSHLESLLEKYSTEFKRIVIIAESVYSMDGDMTDLDKLVEIKSLYPHILIYIDEAHSVGTLGYQGLGMARSHPKYDEIDIVVGTFGKALASMGAFAVTSSLLREYLINMARSFIFSTALPPFVARWSLATFEYSLKADNKRHRLKNLNSLLHSILSEQRSIVKENNIPQNINPLHIQPLIIGDAQRAVKISRKLQEIGFRVLPIRTPTVPAGTERLRFSLSATLNTEDLTPLRSALSSTLAEIV